ncbi:MAG: DUF4270 family protein [Bacteroidales bacterium]|nr:DUF4270 family protein [Bacteroidales bacterium]
MKKKDLRFLAIIFGLIGALASCDIGDKGLGADILPPGDNVIVYLDTIFEIDAYTMRGKPIATSELTYSATRLMLLGSLEDSIFGKTDAGVITQFNTTATYRVASNLEIDSLFLAIYVYDFLGDMDQEITLTVHEFTERIFMDSSYYSDFDIEGKYDPVPLVQQTVTPEDDHTYELLIEDQDFIDKFLAIESDTNYFYNDSIFKDYFNGFYITAEPVSSEGTMSRIQLASSLTRLTMKYANDSTDVDSTAERDFAYAHFTIDQYSSQKINLFEHDYTGTRLAEIIDDEHAATPYSYVQGLSGVNTRFSFASLQEWMDQTPLIINSATLVFDVVPEEESGILYDDLPGRLMIGTILEDDSYEPIYDYYVLLANDPNQQASRFGGYKKAESLGMFSDTTYTYRFNMGLHFQSMVDGTKTDNDFILQLDDGLINPKFSRLWSNLPANERRIRLEIVYLKL